MLTYDETAGSMASSARMADMVGAGFAAAFPWVETTFGATAVPWVGTKRGFKDGEKAEADAASSTRPAPSILWRISTAAAVMAVVAVVAAVRATNTAAYVVVIVAAAR